MIFPLVQDFADALDAMPREHSRYRILKLLDEAIRREGNHLASNPQSVFRQLWNHCCWHGSPQAAAHYNRDQVLQAGADRLAELQQPRLLLWVQEHPFADPLPEHLVLGLEPFDLFDQVVAGTAGE